MITIEIKKMDQEEDFTFSTSGILFHGDCSGGKIVVEPKEDLYWSHFFLLSCQRCRIRLGISVLDRGAEETCKTAVDGKPRVIKGRIVIRQFDPGHWYLSEKFESIGIVQKK